MRVIDRLEFVISEALTALSRNRLMTLAAVTTVAGALFLFGGLGYAYYRLSHYADTIPGKFRMLVYLRDEATRADVEKTAQQIRKLPGVASVAWIPKDKAWERWKQEHQTGLTEGIDNPLPEGFRVLLTDLKQSDQVVASIKAIPMVAPENGVKYMADEANFVEGLLTAMRFFGMVVGGLFFLVAGVLIYNAIRLTVLSRRLEIRIMQLVGSSRLTVYVPFLIEGMLQGIMGAAVAGGLVVGSYFGFGWLVTNHVPIPYTPAPFPYAYVFALLAGAGALYGVMCSMLAIRAPLKYR
ncbi:MAG TPA: permease-like cell division protein FtsX [Fimbriimonadaceae bacterium]|nr:permease-like cell division protein FtsX [Fimbriimonadaceae bacterium]